MSEPRCAYRCSLSAGHSGPHLFPLFPHTSQIAATLTPAVGGLDVERLARALAVEARQQDRAAGRRSGYSSNYFTGQAERVAAAYSEASDE